MDGRVNGTKNRTADLIVALRIGLHRELDRLFTIAQDPNFKGKVGLELYAENGRPAEPRIYIERRGFLE